MEESQGKPAKAHFPEQVRKYSENHGTYKRIYAKMARGEMVRFIAENNIENPVEIQKFDRLGYSFRYDLSSDSEYVFERKIK